MDLKDKIKLNKKYLNKLLVIFISIYLITTGFVVLSPRSYSIETNDCEYIYLTPTNLSDYDREVITHDGDFYLEDLLYDYSYFDLTSINVLLNQTQYQQWNIDDTANKITLEFEYVGFEAGNYNIFGYYLNSDPATFNTIFNASNATIGTKYIENISVSDFNKIGFAIESHPPGPGATFHTHYTDNSLNIPIDDRALVFELCDGFYNKIYVVCFEDLPSSDDFDDVIVIIRVIPHTPVSFDDFITVEEGGTATILSNGNDSVLDNDTDADLDLLTAIEISGPSHGTLTLNSDGTFEYAHDGTDTTSDSFTYKANDGLADSNPATVHITITSENDAPVALDDFITVAEGGTATLLANSDDSVLDNDTDSDSGSLTAIKLSDPSRHYKRQLHIQSK